MPVVTRERRDPPEGLDSCRVALFTFARRFNDRERRQDELHPKFSFVTAFVRSTVRHCALAAPEWCGAMRYNLAQNQVPNAVTMQAAKQPQEPHSIELARSGRALAPHCLPA